MQSIILVAIAGAAGAVTRYGVGVLANRTLGEHFAFGTLLVNVLGCLAIGILVVVYTGYYYKGDQSAWRFLTYMLLFMTSMLGLVLAGDVLTLFLFWEGTSILSYLLVAYKTESKEAL